MAPYSFITLLKICQLQYLYSFKKWALDKTDDTGDHPVLIPVKSRWRWTDIQNLYDYYSFGRRQTIDRFS